MSTANNFMATPPPQRTLPTDQQAMQDGLANNANAATTVANTAVGARDALRLGAGTANFGSNLLTGKNLIGAASMANRFNVPVMAYTLADYAVGEIREDGKGLSELMGEGLGGFIGNKMYGAKGRELSKPFTQEELNSFRSRGSSNGEADMSPSPTEVPSQPLTVQDKSDLATAVPSQPLTVQEQYDLATPVSSDPMTPEGNSEIQKLLQMQAQGAMQTEIPKRGVGMAPVATQGSSLQGIGMAPQIGQLNDAQILEQRGLRELEQKNVGGLAGAYPDRFGDPRALESAVGGMLPDGIEGTQGYAGTTASGVTYPIDRETLEAFQKNQESQKSFSGLMRQEFDSTPVISDTPEAGMVSFIDTNGKLTYGNETAKQMYSADSIENNLSERFKAEQALQGTETPLEAPASTSEGSTPARAPEDSPAPAGMPDEQKTSEQLEYEREIAEDDEGLMKWARDNNKSPEYVEKMMSGIVKRREEAQNEKSLKDMLSELQIEKMRLGNRLLEKELGEDTRHSDVKMPDVKSLYSMMKDQGVVVNPNTGGMTVTEDGFWSDSEKPLAFNSALFQQLAQTPAGRYILDAKPPEISAVTNPEPYQMYDAHDGRVFTHDGESWSVLTNLGGFNDSLVNDEEE